MCAVKIPSQKDYKELNTFFKQKKLLNIFDNPLNLINTYKPVLSDLYSLYQLIILNKRTTILEFGSGWSTLVIQEALRFNKINHTHKTKNLRRNNLYELFVLETNKLQFGFIKVLIPATFNCCLCLSIVCKCVLFKFKCG